MLKSELEQEVIRLQHIIEDVWRWVTPNKKHSPDYVINKHNAMKHINGIRRSIGKNYFNEDDEEEDY